MSEVNIAELLSHLRKEAKLTLKEVARQAVERGIPISFKTISGYEKGRSIPNADIFLALCDIYGSKNPVEDLKKLSGEIYETESGITAKEEKHLERYRKLDKYGKKAVDTILALESERSINVNHTKKKSKIGAEYDDSLLIAASGAENLDEEGKERARKDIEDIMRKYGGGNDQV